MSRTYMSGVRHRTCPKATVVAIRTARLAERAVSERATSGVRHRTCPDGSVLAAAPRLLRPARVELLRLADLVRVGAAVVRARHLEHRRQPLEARAPEEHAQLLAEHALEDVRVPVA